MRDPFQDRTLVRFLAVGGGIALLYAVLAALATSHLPLPKTLSSGVIWVLCIPFGYWLQRRYTFTGRTPKRHGLWFYGATQFLGLGIVAIVSFLLATGRFWPDLGVHLLASALAAIVSFLINHWVVFPDSPGS